MALDPRITRRDFVNGGLAGAGASLLNACAPAERATAVDPWTGYGGIGDYAKANGNTRQVIDAAHRIRDRVFDGKAATDTGETYDAVIVGGGFGGLGALHELRRRKPNGRFLILDNSPVFGGYAKANLFDVDGYRVASAQASMNFMAPATPEDRVGYWDEFGLPSEIRFADREYGDRRIKFPKATSSPLYVGEQSATTGYFFGSKGWATDIWNGDLARAHWPQPMKNALLALRARRREGRVEEGQEARRLDRMTFADFATRELGATPEALAYITKGMCISGPQISAYGAQSLPNLERYAEGSAGAKAGERFVSFADGNTVLARHFVKAAWPDAIKGPSTLDAIATGALDPAAFDRPGAPCRMRLGATVVRLAHKGDPAAADQVEVIYEKGGKLYRIAAKGAVMAVGQWVSKHVIADLPAERRAAADRHLYAPILIANVALTNWRFLDRLGFAAMRWFDGFGFYASVRRPAITGGRPAPFHPDKPIVMTIYAPMQYPDLPLEAQGPAGRADMFGTSYADYEQQIIGQMQALFSAGGFEPRRDVAGIILNRWGHAFITPPPGFFFGTGGGPAPSKLALERFGRIVFTSSADWLGTALGGKRAAEQILPLI
jgi:spermidine dehydrogenase